MPRVLLAFTYFRSNGVMSDLSIADVDGNTVLHQAVTSRSNADLEIIVTNLGQYIDPNMANTAKDTVSTLAAITETRR